MDAKSLSLRPLLDRIIVEEIEEEDVTAGGVFLPDAARDRPQRGLVLAVGPGGYAANGEQVPIPLVPGDVVVYNKYGGTEVRPSLIDDKVLILREGDILAVINEEAHDG